MPVLEEERRDLRAQLGGRVAHEIEGVEDRAGRVLLVRGPHVLPLNRTRTLAVPTHPERELNWTYTIRVFSPAGYDHASTVTATAPVLREAIFSLRGRMLMAAHAPR